MPLPQPFDLIGATRASDLDATMSLVALLVDVELDPGRRVLEEPLHILVQLTLIALEPQHVVSTALDDLPGNGVLAAHGVDAYRRSLEIKHPEQLGDRGDLVALLRHRLLGKHDTRLGGEGTDQMQCLPVPVATASQGLAIDGDLRAVGQDEPVTTPALKALPKLPGVERTEDAAQGVVARYPVLEGQVLAQQLEPGPTEGLDLVPPFAAGEHPADRGQQDLGQGMEACSLHARVFQVLEMIEKVLQLLRHGHDGSLETTSCRDKCGKCAEICQI